MSNTEYMREYRRRNGGEFKSTPTDRARARANSRAAKWVYDNMPELFVQMLAEERTKLGLSVDIAVVSYSKPIAHGEPRGASAHRYRGEKPCPACREALNADRRRKYAEAKAAT